MNKLKVQCVWTVKERQGDLWVPVLQRKNIFTNYGLSALASAISGNYVAPIYLSVDSTTATITNAGGISSGATSVTLSQRVDQGSDTQIVLDIGTPQQEVVTFSSVTSVSPYVYTLSTPTANTHAAGAYVVRQVSASDTLANVLSEVQYDPVNAANQRLGSAAGFSSGPGQWTIQWYFTATMATSYFATIGMTDSATIGQGNLHNHLVLGYDHTAGTNDVQIDGNLTLVNG